MRTTLRTLWFFLSIMQLIFVAARTMARTDGTTMALLTQSQLQELVNNYTNFCAGLSKIGHIDPTTGTTTQIINGLINNGFMN